MTDDARGSDRGSDELRSWLERHAPALRAFIRLKMGAEVRAREESSDLAQSVCRQVLENLDGLQFRDEGAFRQWLYTTALNKVIDKHRFYKAQRRARAREVELPEDENLLACYSMFCSPSREAVLRDEIARVERAFDQLPEDYREVVLLSRVAGLQHAEISKQLGRTEGAVRNVLYRALSRLSFLLEGG